MFRRGRGRVPVLGFPGFSRLAHLPELRTEAGTGVANSHSIGSSFSSGRSRRACRRERSMVDTAQAKYPSDMLRAAHPREEGIETMASDLVDSITQYAKDRPSFALLWALGIGFVLGWK